MYINRILETTIEKYISKKEVIAVVGTRQCGKTTMLKHIFEKLERADFITFEDRETLELFTQDIKTFVEKFVKPNKYLFIDEFQYAKEGGKQLKYIYDNNKTKIIISGSSALELTLQGLKYLVGRIFVFELYPLSFQEYLSYKDSSLSKTLKRKTLPEATLKLINKHYEEHIIYGGYPRVVLSKDPEEKIEVLKNIYNTYFLREIKEVLQITTDFKLAKLFKILALQIGGVVNYSELSDSTGIKHLELLNHINVLIKTFVCAESRPFYTNKKKELVKAPKIYFVDTGLRNFAIKNFQKLENRSDQGALNENFAAMEIIKSSKELKYWRTKAKAEVDFILEQNGAVIPIEIKSTLNQPKITRSFGNFIEEYSPQKAYILSKNLSKRKTMSGATVEFMPLIKITKLIEEVNLHK